ncbi:hypothetical protein CcaverHIS002_0606580 [Cutaneotrichosporon cavernicola]|uniref:GATA-type domain-containing protein n=1 Tax=Cutaneotrichosporon cavernicola TaxID=279322 RepID=A0AA48QYA3_9TREE|nr:uncharacterized protein CcaverHIS019_0606020 [Cutaneotrichosporon cavernicola]BEI86371.1 hypothetical protein CcaverHIS002_0606580 [Cutaneotrichosporon cavernicola]BEI94143.1 hypothetical protein CcaverHIS019_0606020 [Cutaneotrichosporon cavernicola]BEJ01923.1 hypothetical protein CcaverHIS631_0606050 [Cutaneotrichosporon cavernicola]BEJ09687.1 hypothetical protein CcaverHIS641_0606020 [Cutaneotrichosporon cavernicola]
MSTITLPSVGRIRCYWALLAPQYGSAPGGGGQLELKFVYLDPVLSNHLGPQSMSVLNHGLIDLIHPDEREQARNDLASAIQSDDLQGSVTRMRFSRLSRIRQMCGAQPGDIVLPPDMDTVTEDSDYLIIDLVLNWVADGLLLAFLHAIKDFDPQANNDPSRQQEGWSNFCGSTGMTDGDLQTLQQSISNNVTPPPRTRYPPTRVLQIHAVHHNAAQPTTLVFTWPPARPTDKSSPQFDGLYDADEYAELMRGVDMDPNALAAKPGEVRTNCTTRFGAEHSIRTEGLYRHVTSVFIPYGKIVFSCFQTTNLYELPNNTAGPTGPTHEGWNAPHTAPQQAPPAHPPQPAVSNGPQQEWRPEYERGYAAPAPTFPASEYPAHGTYPPPAQYDAGYGHSAEPVNHAPVSQTRGGSTRPLVRPPGDIEKCRGCGTRESPEWRKGENGVKDLCNACGLKLARAVAKREGRQKPRKKDK